MPSGPIPYGTPIAPAPAPFAAGFPKWMYNAAGDSVLIETPEDLASLPETWSPAPPNHPGSLNNPDIGPKFLPTEKIDEALLDCRILELHLTNAGDQAADVFVYDRQATPIPLVLRKALAPGDIIIISSPKGFNMPGGVTWWASTPNVSGRMLLTY